VSERLGGRGTALRRRWRMRPVGMISIKLTTNRRRRDTHKVSCGFILGMSILNATPPAKAARHRTTKRGFLYFSGNHQAFRSADRGGAVGRRTKPRKTEYHWPGKRRYDYFPQSREIVNLRSGSAAGRRFNSMSFP
jgi:hypothetical protein